MSMANSYYKGKPVEESRQQYATARIQQMQMHFVSATRPLSFEVLRDGFITYGEFYDQGYRLTDGRAAA